MKSRQFYVYLLVNKTNRVIYTGCTNNLERRLSQHRLRLNPGSFTARYNVTKLVYYEVFDGPVEMIDREKQIKAGSRKKKIELIKSINPEFKDLSNGWS